MGVTAGLHYFFFTLAQVEAWGECRNPMPTPKSRQFFKTI
ncbi:MAG: hypothetical protein RI894_168 [Bacteroidota bacterium]